jgi:LysR family transcriptional regulator for bpeEF and oprC
VALTREGEIFLARCREAVASIQSGRETVSESRRVPRGEVHVTTSPILSRFVVAPLGPFLARHPRLSFRLTVTDRLVRLAEEGIDVAVRIGELRDSALVARRLRATRWVTVASPSFVARHGPPSHPRDLERLECLRFVGPDGRPREWLFADPGSRQPPYPVRVEGRVLVDEGERLLDAAIAGVGVCQVLDFMVGPRISDGTLVEVLGSHAAAGPPITALAAPERGRSANVRAIFTFLAEVFRAPAAPP